MQTISIEILSDDEKIATSIADSLRTLSPSDFGGSLNVSGPEIELGAVSFTEVVTLTMGFAAGVASDVIASMIYDKIIAATNRKSTVSVRRGDLQVDIKTKDDLVVVLRSEER